MDFIWKALVLACFLLRLCVGQTILNHTQTTLTTIKISSSACNFCYLDLAGSSGNSVGPGRFPPIIGVYFIVTAYSVSSAFTTDGDCVTITGTPVTLSTPFSVVAAPEPSATDPEWFGSIVESKFATWLPAAPTCSVSPPCTGAYCDSSADAETGASRFLIVGVFLAVAGIFTFVCYVGPKLVHLVTAAKDKKSRTQSEHMHKPTPFLQQKPELDAETKWENELEAQDQIYELGSRERYEIKGDGARAEMTGTNTENGPLPSLIERHELRGEEHSKELEGHGI